MSILEQILKTKQIEAAELEQAEPLEDLKKRAEACPPALGFAEKLGAASQPAIIAEIKRASPSRGKIREDLDPIQTALDFAANGAAAISVLTDAEFFSGDKKYLRAIKDEFNTQGLVCPPLLRKDFIITEHQVWETRALGADAILLIAAALSEELLAELLECSLSAGLDVLLEVHSAEELRSSASLLQTSLGAYRGPARVLLGCNNRDLSTFETKLSVTEEISEQLKSIQVKEDSCEQLKKIKLVSESGIFSALDLQTLRTFGANAFLIGESLVASGDPGENLRKLISDFNNN